MLRYEKKYPSKRTFVPNTAVPMPEYRDGRICRPNSAVPMPEYQRGRIVEPDTAIPMPVIPFTWKGRSSI